MTDTSDMFDYRECVENGNLDLWGEKRYQTLAERKDKGAFSVDAMKSLTVVLTKYREAPGCSHPGYDQSMQTKPHGLHRSPIPRKKGARFNLGKNAELFPANRLGWALKELKFLALHYKFDWFNMICKYQNKWCGMPLMKGAIETTAYQLLLQEEKPVTIIELGTWQGTSAAWMADLSKVFGQKTHVYTVDIDDSLLNEKARRDNVTFIQGDCMKIEDVFPDDMLKKLPHPWFISEDAHVNVVGVLEHLLRFAQAGDMICVEDTNPDGPAQPMYGDNEYKPFGNEKLDQLKDFLKRNQERVKIDRLYTDLFGYNGGLNWHGYLKVF